MVPVYVRFDGQWPRFQIVGVNGGEGLLARVTPRDENTNWQVSIPRCFAIPEGMRFTASSRRACREVSQNTFQFDFLQAAEDRLMELLFEWSNLRQEYPHLEEATGLQISFLADDE